MHYSTPELLNTCKPYLHHLLPTPRAHQLVPLSRTQLLNLYLAIVAVRERLLRAAYYILKTREPYKDLGANYLDKQGKEHLLGRLCRGIQQLGYQVSLQLPSHPTA